MDLCDLGFLASILTMFELSECQILPPKGYRAEVIELDGNSSQIFCGIPRLSTRRELIVWDSRRSQKDAWLPYGTGDNITVVTGWYYRCKYFNESTYTFYTAYIPENDFCEKTEEVIWKIIMYIAVGVIFGLVILALAGYFVRKRCKSKTFVGSAQKLGHPNRNAVQKLGAPVRNLVRTAPNSGFGNNASQRSVDEDGYILPLRDPSLYDDVQQNSDYMEVLPNTASIQGIGPLYENVYDLREK